MNELAHRPPQEIVNVADSALSIDQIVKQRALITDVMAKAMKEDQHYGKVPGCGDKPTLLQPGAQLLAHLFRLRPEYEVIETDLPHENKRFRVTCRLFFIGSQPEIKISEGVGESSSMESKHRFRNAAPVVTPTGDPVPSTYWDIKNKRGIEAAKQWAANSYDGKNVSTKKIDGAWQFVIVEGGSDEKVENPNPADVFNTVLKIAKKRAFVDATITATASSDFFTQDLEDIRDNLESVAKSVPETSGKPPAPLPTSPPPAGTRAAGGPAESSNGWRAVECTYGKKGGPLRGKKLGELNPSNLKYLAEKFLTEGAKVDEKDRKMVAALAMWKGESESPPAKSSPHGASATPKREELASLLDWERPEITKEDFISAMKSAKHIPTDAAGFQAMSEETAAKFIDDFENCKVIVRQWQGGNAK